MPPRSGQLDQISQAIGGLQASVEGIEKYIHDRRHDDASVSMKIDGLSGQITREVSRMKAEIQVQLEAISARVTKLEDAAAAERGARSVITIILQSPLIGWVFAAAVVVWAAIRGKHG